MPALSQAREAARAVQCLNHLRQLGIAGTQYYLDAKGVLPTIHGSPNYATNNAPMDNWWRNTALREYLGVPPWASNAKSNRTIYRPGWQVLVCPGDRYWDERGSDRWTSYAGNTATGGRYHQRLPWDTHPDAVAYADDFLTPSRIIWFADWGGPDGTGADVLGLGLATDPFLYPNTPDRFLHYRHSERVNLLFLDGHVARSADQPVPTAVTQPEMWRHGH